MSFECSDSLIEQGVNPTFLADFLGCQTGAESVIQSAPFLIGEQGVKHGAEVALTGAKWHRQNADKNTKISLQPA